MNTPRAARGDAKFFERGFASMPQGYYTVGQWVASSEPGRAGWVERMELPLGTSLTEAEAALEKLEQPGFFRISQVRRAIRAEENGCRVEDAEIARRLPEESGKDARHVRADRRPLSSGGRCAGRAAG